MEAAVSSVAMHVFVRAHIHARVLKEALALAGEGIQGERGRT